MTHTHPGDPQDPTAQISFRELYDALMREIEPELTSDQLPLVAVRCAEDTPEQRKSRAERYAKAIALFDERLSALYGMWKEELLAFKKEALANAHTATTKADARTLQHLDDSIAAA